MPTDPDSTYRAIIYPTETIYALGVNAFDETARALLYTLKGRDEGKAVSILVRDITDMERYAVANDQVRALVAAFLPGPLTLVLAARSETPRCAVGTDGTISMRISSDPQAQALIQQYMEAHDAPLTCTSSNVSGLPPAVDPNGIRQQFQQYERDVAGVHFIDGGPRSGSASTVVGVVGDTITIHRHGDISEDAIYAAVRG